VFLIICLIYLCRVMFQEMARVRQEYELRIHRVTEDVGKMRGDYERRIQDYDMKLGDSERRSQALAQESAKLKGEYEAKLINIAQEARTLRTDYEAKIDLMQRQLDAQNANLNVSLTGQNLAKDPWPDGDHSLGNHASSQRQFESTNGHDEAI